MRTLLIYIFAAFTVLRTLPDLRRVKKISDSVPIKDKNERVFQAPQNVALKVIERTGTKVNVRGQNKLPNGPVLYVSNHQGIFDILVLIGFAGKPLGFIAKKEIKKIPIVRAWMDEMQCVFIDRANRREAIKVISKGIDNLKNGQSMVIFPEGTRSRGAKLHEFKSGSLRLGTKAGVPIVPVAINGTYNILENNNGKIKAADVTIEICDPIYPDQYETKKNTEIAKDIQRTIERAIINHQN
ncbi:lysophospholipid acyltransferase family protein [Aquibacillus saliphilus]|uniref:lysophospholipid acyltransferase family protein n=1 Tax=Aquibacillus saliphilus TaxID=1909422 RepID=UPI001CF0531A|nr:lysophospholipid acyltransferase family protein [Aquibacillus saliphilus]